MSIYTKQGDQGFTKDDQGQKVSKADPVIEVYGVLDELNVYLGFAREALRNLDNATIMAQQLEQMQRQLLSFNQKISTLTPLQEAIVDLEDNIDVMEKALPALHDFILPGGSEVAVRLHLARVTCRRAERLLVRYLAVSGFPAEIITYLNRVGDWLYVAARFIMIND
jgi:cob(I)alamin adenosyltransferase